MTDSPLPPDGVKLGRMSTAPVDRRCKRCGVAKPLDAYPVLYSGVAKTCAVCRSAAARHGHAAMRAATAFKQVTRAMNGSPLPPMPKGRRCNRCHGPMPSPRMTYCGTCGPEAAPRVFGILSLTGAVWPVTQDEYYREVTAGGL